ncbi:MULTISPECIES: 1,6-anhydro-N-acetylmuramyl-L-alanine amidase AmpD [unclassified Acidovorax]|uniref:1,6-anhydro-N-acetylmuramyl-L-alanine amidase AmpD n=1 Tax=unclassified Acidovorax TaxID=2684926 RepID=UPI0006FA85F1|nr:MULTISPECIES: 1,6-anhydro-N-acetylmuramyl-L-alanine amidase AmpD [unclassified Acidovorax]KRB42316.1 N-acetyl-anhydromuranmyl-L-alanine amidase [Acidovorax sp. Root70]PUA95383.1 AmpD protein [Acidovorax sp. 107]
MTTWDEATSSAASPPWEGGWHRAARELVSPNHGPRPVPASQVDLIVVHSISLPPGEYGGGAVQQLFTNTLDWDAHPYYQGIRGLQVSTHFFIERTGALWQFVDCDLRAWHAGQSFYRGRSQCNDDSIGIELEGLEGLHFEPAQYETLARVCQDVALRYPIEHIAGHEHIAPGRKQDPGPGFDWPRLQGVLSWPVQRFPQGIRTSLSQLPR